MGAGWTRWYRPGGDIRPKLFVPVSGWPTTRVVAVMGRQPRSRSTSYAPVTKREMYWLGNAEHFQFRTEICGRFSDDDETPGTWLGQPRTPSPFAGFTMRDPLRVTLGTDCGPACRDEGDSIAHDTRDPDRRHPCRVYGHHTANMACLVHSGVHYGYPIKGRLLRDLLP